MVRWEPGASDRLRAAALELYATHGFEQTTAADIAASVGLSERTFFRYFADKREVIFLGQAEFEAGFVDGVQTAPDGSAMDIVTSALEKAAAFFPDDYRDHSRLRQRVIKANPSLHERELLKMTSLAQQMTDALRSRGIPDPQATLAAQSAVTIFGVSFRQWLAPGEERPLAEIQREMLAELRAVTAAPLGSF